MPMQMGTALRRNGGLLPSLKRWNGLSGTTQEWNCLDRDPELWIGNGNCLVYLHDRTVSIPDPSFKIPFSELVAAKCQPLIKRFVEFSGQKYSQNGHTATGWEQINQRRTVELYMAPRHAATDREVIQHRLAVRNFLAWVMQVPIVGDHLGTALVSLLQTMHLYRSRDADSITDLTRYLDTQGYTFLINQPAHALAMLQLAEHARLQDLYTQAFAHCVGMGDGVISNSEYPKTSLQSRKLIRAARDDMFDRLERTSDMLSTFLDRDLSESHVGLSSESREHLEQFRGFLAQFYATRFGGQYPPTKFEATMLLAMRQDFAAMYDLLVDDGPASFGASFSMASGGICTTQHAQSFDSRHGLKSLRHLSPLIPQVAQTQGNRRKLWKPQPNKVKTSTGLIAHTALIQASNWKETTASNDLVQAYRTFEGKSVQTNGKKDRLDPLSLVDARKVRWILIYTTYQILCRATTRPSQTEGDDAPYHLNASVESLPPWNKTLGSLNMPSSLGGENAVYYTQPEDDVFGFGNGSVEIKPDIDYYTPTHQEPEKVARRSSVMSVTERASQTLTRSTSITRALSRSGTLRRSLRRSNTTVPSSPQTKQKSLHSPAHQEILVHGYGNGTFGADAAAEESSFPMELTMRARAAIERLDSSTIASQRDSQAETFESSSSLETSALPSPASPASEASIEVDIVTEWQPDEYPQTPIARNSSRRSLTQLYPLKSVMGSLGRASSTKRPATQDRRHSSSFKDASPSSPYGGLTRSLSLRIPDLKRRSRLPESASSPVQIRELHIDEMSEEDLHMQADADEWNDMEAFLDGGRSPSCVAGEGILPAWEQYSDLGGLTRVC